jgi:hypothetical protein
MKPVNSFNLCQLSCATGFNLQLVEGDQYFVEVEEITNLTDLTLYAPVAC